MLWIVQLYFFSLFRDWQGWKESWISSYVLEYGPTNAHTENNLYFIVWQDVISSRQTHYETYLQLEQLNGKEEKGYQIQDFIDSKTFLFLYS